MIAAPDCDWPPITSASTGGNGGKYSDDGCLMIDHQWSMDPRAPPILFETMIFGGQPEDEMSESYQRRYSTWDEAEKGHAEAVEHARELVAKADAALKTSSEPGRASRE